LTRIWAKPKLRLRIQQLEAAETRTSLILRALTCFYTAVAGFVASTLVSLIGAVMVSAQTDRGVSLAFTLAFLAGAIGVFAMIVGAILLARESRFSFRVLQKEKNFLTSRVQERVAKLPGATSNQQT
jgi:polyferredoxin